MSKLIIMGIFFACIHRLLLFTFSIFTLLLLRTCTGGLHFDHYLSCLIVSFLIIGLSVVILPHIYTAKWLQLLILIGCIIINYLYAPIVSKYRPIPEGIRVRKAKKQSFIIITIYALILFVFPPNTYICVGFWTIVLQSLQLIAAKYMKGGVNQ